MKQWWQVQAARIDAMTLRERVILFLVLIFVALAMADALLLSPAQTAHKQVVQRHAACVLSWPLLASLWTLTRLLGRSWKQPKLICNW